MVNDDDVVLFGLAILLAVVLRPLPGIWGLCDLFWSGPLLCFFAVVASVLCAYFFRAQATLARTLGKVAPPTPTPGQVFAISQLDAMLEALKDRRDLAKVETAMKNLTLLAQRLRPREGAVGDGVRRILDKGVVPTLMAALRTDDLKVFAPASSKMREW